MDDVWGMTVRITHEATADRPMVRRALSLLFAPGEWHELRALPSGKGRVIQADDLDAAYAAVESLADQQVYYSLNPISPGSDRASKKTVLSRRWFLVDVDAVKPKDVSSTEEERVKAATVAGAVLEYLLSLGWPAPLMIDSGNGWHLLYRIDLPNDALSQGILKTCLYALGEKFSGESGVIDRSTHDAPRISKLPGTMARKGPDTPDRPHRLCRIVYEPETLEVVPVELLQKLGNPPPEPPASTNGKHDPWTAGPSVGGGSGGLTAYLKRAVESECLKVALEITDRNIQLNKSAFVLGQFASWPEMNEHETKATLQLAAERAGLTDREIIKTIASGWEAGTKKPRPRPQEPAKGKAKDALPDKLTVGADEVNPESVTWLWPDRIALGFISLFAGRTGVGKSFVLCDVAARLSVGKPFPDGSPARPIGGTLFISEDPYRFVLVPRLIELGADRRKVGFLKWEVMAKYQLSDTGLLEQAWQERGRPELIVIDPPANFLGGRDEHKNAEVRSVLMKIVAWLENKPVAMALITHYNKGGAQKALDALDRIMGSVAWSSSSRVACGFVVDPSDQSKCVFGGIKNNLGQKALPLSYRIQKTPTLATVEWLGKSEMSFEDAMANSTSKKVDVAKFFIDRFREQLEWPSEDLLLAAAKLGIGRTTCFDVKKALGVESRPIRNASGKIVEHRWFVQRDWKWFSDTVLNSGNSGTVVNHNYVDNNKIGETDQSTNHKPF